ncbi:MAG: TlpA family protein disulfide reductase [Candidatus Brocadia sp. AMX3]|nr:TlpA family protein disulfide reductase [Candidatus Brocadia sp.]MCE7910992.1 TlpA family protein disulfide reductase [Candidatus Brocadia sp. AMX3]MDG5995753.1 TlpA family protein disulfide reductase [Candidatus Brocadia sp.]
MIFFITSAISHAGDSVNKIKLADLNALIEGNKGKVVIVDLWATWCPPCRKEIPGFINLYNKHRSKGVEIIGIAFDENGVEVVPPAVKKMGINYPVYLGGGDIAEAHDLQAYPTTLVYGKDGKIASRHVGFVSEKEFDDEIGMLLKK